MRAVLPDLLQLGNGQGLQLGLPEPKEEDKQATSLSNALRKMNCESRTRSV